MGSGYRLQFTRLGQVLDEVSGNGSRVSAGAVATIRRGEDGEAGREKDDGKCNIC